MQKIIIWGTDSVLIVVSHAINITVFGIPNLWMLPTVLKFNVKPVKKPLKKDGAYHRQDLLSGENQQK